MNVWDERIMQETPYRERCRMGLEDADAFVEGARWMRETLLSGEAVLRALNAEEPRAATDNLADWGEESIARMRAALAAALGEDENDE